MKTIGLIPSQTLASLEQDADQNWLNVPEGQTVVPLVKIAKPVVSAGFDYVPKLVWFEDRVERQWEQIKASLDASTAVSQLSFRLACGKELWRQIEAAVASIPDSSAQWEAEQYILKSATVRRDHPLVISLAAALGQTPEQVDAIFTAAKAKDNVL